MLETAVFLTPGRCGVTSWAGVIWCFYCPLATHGWLHPPCLGKGNRYHIWTVLTVGISHCAKNKKSKVAICVLQWGTRQGYVTWGTSKQAMATTAKPMNPKEEWQRQSGDVLGNAVHLITGEEHFYKSWKGGERRVLSISLPGGVKDGHKDQKIMIQHSTCKLLECTYNSTCKFQCLEKWYLIVHLSLLTI